MMSVYNRPKAGGEVHHAGSYGKGTGQKCSDHQTIPICRKHHYEHDSIGKKKFQEKYDIDFKDIWKMMRFKAMHPYGN